MERPLALAISGRGSFLSMFWIMNSLRAELAPVVFTIRSSGRMISFSSTYLLIRAIKSLPYFLAFPSPTPKTLVSSEIVIGYFIHISSKEASWKTTKGGTPNSLATFLRKSLRYFKSVSSRTEMVFLAGSSISSSKLWSSVIIKECGFLRKSRPLSVRNITP